jgi:hypothetical protein
MAVPLVAWGLRTAPRIGGLLVALTAVTSVWWFAELRIDGGAIIGPSSRAPLGPLDAALPLFGTGSLGATAAFAAVGAALLALLVFEWRSWRARSVG